MNDSESHAAESMPETKKALTTSSSDSLVHLGMAIEVSCESDSIDAVLRPFYLMVNRLLQNSVELHSIRVEPLTQAVISSSPQSDD